VTHVSRLSTILFVALLFAPFVAAWYIEYRLMEFQRDPTEVLWGFSGLRPDRYTDEGQDWVRRLWLVLVLLIPWCVLVALVFGVGQ
jgi:hypothetical protein